MTDSEPVRRSSDYLLHGRIKDGMTVSTRLKNNFIAGIVLIAPLVVTLFVLRILVNWSLQVIDPVVEGTRLATYTANNRLLAQVMAFVLILVTVTLLGYLARRSIGRHVFGNIGRIVNVIPLVNTVYGSVKQVANALVERTGAYESVALVEYPREDMYSIGFVTGSSPAAVEGYAEKPVYNVFLPNSPNPTGGRLILLPEDQVHEVDMSVRRGMRLLVTTGVGVDEATSSLPPLDPETE